ncbi:hypothetical protein LPJ69_003971, partial [Coemansia sp. RSA 1752]
KQFCCNNARPHVSFALAYALHRVATDMVAYPDKYPKVHGVVPHMASHSTSSTIARSTWNI